MIWLLILVFILVSGFIWYVSKRHIDHFTSFEDPYLSSLVDKLSTEFPELKLFQLRGSHKSFTVDKEHMYICILDSNQKYYEENTIIHVILHELAHALCSTQDFTEEHSPEFHRIFEKLLTRASNAGLYDAQKSVQKGYCGYT